MHTGFMAMRLGSIIYFIPFLFVLDNGLLLQGDALSILIAVLRAVIAIVLVTAGLQGYLLGYGGLPRWWSRLGVLGAGVLIAVI